MEITLEQEKLDIIEKAIKSNERYTNNEDLYDKFLEEALKRGLIIFKTMDFNSSSTSVYLNKIVASSIVFILGQEQRLDFIETNYSEKQKIAEDTETVETEDINSETIQSIEAIEEPKSQENDIETDQGSIENAQINDVQTTSFAEETNSVTEKEEIKEAEEIAEVKEEVREEVKKEEAAKKETSQNNIKNKFADEKIEYNFDYSPVISGATIKPKTLQIFYDSVVISNSQSPEKEYLQIYNLRYIQKLPLTKIAQKLNISQEIVSQNLYELMEKVRKTLE